MTDDQINKAIITALGYKISKEHDDCYDSWVEEYPIPRKIPNYVGDISSLWDFMGQYEILIEYGPCGFRAFTHFGASFVSQQSDRRTRAVAIVVMRVLELKAKGSHESI